MRSETEVLTLAKFYKTGVTEWKRFNYCQAWVSCEIFNSAFGVTFKLIKSYNTIVGLVDMDNEIIYELGKWSRTTTKQVSQIHNQLFRGYDRILLDITTEDRMNL